MFSSPIVWFLAVLVLTSIALLFIGVIKKNKTALIASAIVFLIFIGIMLWFTPLSVEVSPTIEVIQP